MTSSILSKLNPFSKKETEIPRQEIPIKDITNIIHTKDDRYKIILKVVDPINSDLLGEDDIETAIMAIQDCNNSLNQTAQILISSERVDISEYINYLDNKASEARDAFTLDRIEEKKKFLLSRSNNTRTVHNFYFVITSQFKKLNDAYEELEDLSSSFIEYLEMADMSAICLTEVAAKKVLYEKLNPQTSLTQPFDPSINLRNISPNPINDHGGYLEMDDMFYSFYTFSYFPDEVKPSWLKRVLNVRANLDCSITLTPEDKSKVQKSTSDKIQEIESKLLGRLPAMYRTKYEKEKESLQELLSELQNDSENLFNVTFVLAIREDNLEDLKSAQKRLETSISSSKLRSKKLVFKGQYLMWYTLPIAYSNTSLEQQIGWPMQSSTVSAILPFDSSSLQYAEGILKGFQAKKETPIIYDRFNGKLFNNPNEIVLGESGSGKSFYLTTDMIRQSTSGSTKRIFVIDPEREYFLPNAERIVFKLGSEFVTNPFHIRSAIIDSDDESLDGKADVGQYLRLKIGEMMSFFKWIIPDLNGREKAELLKAITLCYNEVGLDYDSRSLPKLFPTMTMLDQVLRTNFKDTMINVINTLDPFRGKGKKDEGVYACMFDGQTNWDLNSSINVLDIHELSEEIQKPMMDLLLKDVWEEVKIDREEHQGFYVDEAHILADEENKQSMKFLFQLYKRIRKYGGFSTVATQNVEDFLSIGKYGGAILNNSFIKTFMRMSEKDIHEIQKFMTFSKKELQILGARKTRGRGIHMVGTKRLDMQTKASFDELKIIDPKQAAKLDLAD
jgi:conjugal transfer ATP-binding protein TraC